MSRRMLTKAVLIIGLFLAASTALASSGTGISWSFQETGHRTSSPVTALAMRDGLTWPVIFSGDFRDGYDSSYVKAISLYPVVNPQTSTFWHIIGNNLMPMFGGSNSVYCPLRAASSPTGEFAAVSKDGYDYYCGYAVTCSSQTGFANVVGSNVCGIDYDMEGNLITLAQNTLPSLDGTWGGYPVDIDSSIPGTIGAVSFSQGKTVYHHTCPLLNGWYSFEVPISPGVFQDMALDTLGRPHMSLFKTHSYSIVVKDFDVMSGIWTETCLDSVEDYRQVSTMAADSKGGVGITWVGDGGVLKYAYKNGNSAWTTHTVAANVIGQEQYPELLEAIQTPGLAFDANDFPVISFVTDSGNIWLAYDPPSTIPEPGAITLLLSALGTFLFYARNRVMQNPSP